MNDGNKAELHAAAALKKFKLVEKEYLIKEDSSSAFSVLTAPHSERIYTNKLYLLMVRLIEKGLNEPGCSCIITELF